MLNLTDTQIKTARKIIKEYYFNITRYISDAEVIAEIESIKRKDAKGSLDDTGNMMLAEFVIKGILPR